MKKVLLATSFLVAGAGFAAAEVSLSGDGRMGIVYNGDDWNFSSRARVKFNLTGETDTGLSFGAAFRVDQEDELGSSASTVSAGSIWVSGAFGKIEMGDTVGAAEAVLFDLPEVGFTDLDGNAAPGSSGANEGDYLTGDGADSITNRDNPSLLYTYSFDAFTFAASFTDGYQGLSSTDDNQAFALGAKYAAGNYSVSLAYETIDMTSGVDPSAIWLGATAAFGDTTVYALYGSFDDRAVSGVTMDDQIGLGVEHSFGDIGVSAYLKQTNYSAVIASIGDDSVLNYGIGASYSLGGGATVVGGIADSNADNAKTVADLGIKFSF